MKKLVLLTRPKEDQELDRELFTNAGFDVLSAPCIGINLLNASEIINFSKYDFLILTSKNSVRALSNLKYEIPKEIKVATQGQGTAQEFFRYYQRPVDFISKIGESLAFAEELINLGSKFLIIGAVQGRQVLKDRLLQAGKKVSLIKLYETVPLKVETEILEAFKNDSSDKYIAFYSPSAVKALSSQIDLMTYKLLSIGPVTSRQIQDLGCQVFFEAKIPQTDCLIRDFLSKT